MRLLGKYITAGFRKQMEYKLNFILLCLAVTPIHLINLFFSWAVIKHFGNIGNWEFKDMAFLYAMFLTPYSVSQIFFRQFRSFDSYVINGKLDLYLLRPNNLLFTLVFADINIMEIFSQLVPSSVVLIYVCIGFYKIMDPLKLYVLVQGLVGGILIISCLFMLIGLSSFWIYRTSGLGDVFFTFKEYTNYPLAIYSREVKFFLTFCLPLAFVNYYPSAYILEKDKSMLAFLTLPVGLLLVIITFLVWKKAIRRYSSTGS